MMHFVRPHQTAHHWDENCLLIPFHGHYNETRMHDTLCEVQSAVQHDLLSLDTSCWTRMVVVQDCVSHDAHATNLLDEQLNQFNRWAGSKGCIATAVVMPPERLESFLRISSLSEDPHNGVRVFFDRYIAEQWLIQQQQRYRRSKLH